MKLELYDREVATPGQRVSTTRDLNIGTGAPKAQSNLATQLNEISSEIALKVKVANETMEYSKSIANAKSLMVDNYTERSKDVKNHATLVSDTDEVFKDIKEKTLEGITDIAQKARITQGLDNVGVMFHSKAAGDANQQAVVQVRADHVELRDANIREAAISSDENMESIISRYGLEMRSLAGAGIFDMDYAEKDILAFGKDAIHGKARFLINDNPWQAKDYLENKESLARFLDPVQRGSLIAQAQSQMNVRESRAKTQRNAAKSAVEKENKVEVAASIKQLEKGIIPLNYDDLLQTVRGTELESKLVSAHAIADDITVFNSMSPSEKQIFIDGVEASGRLSGVEAEKIEILDKNLQYTRKQLAAGNGLELAFEQGVIDELPPLAYEFPELMRERKEAALMASEHFYPTDPKSRSQNQPIVSPITTGEASQLIGEMDAMIVTDRVERLGVMVDAWDSLALPAFEQLAKKGGGVYAISGALVNEGRADTAIEVMNGRETIKAYPKIIPKDFIYAYSELVGNTYGQDPRQEGYIRESTQALYAQLLARSGTTAPEMADKDDIETALKAITGGIYDLDTETFGFNDTYKIEAPRHDVEQDEFEDWLERISPEDILQMGGTASDEDVARRINEGKIRLITLGGGRYGVQMPDGRPVMSNTGQGLVLRYPE